MYCTTATVIVCCCCFFYSTVSTFDFEGSLYYTNTRGPHYLFGGRHRGAPLYILISVTAITYPPFSSIW